MTELNQLLLSNQMPEIDSWLKSLSDEEIQPLKISLLEIMTDENHPVLERISAGNALGLLGDPRIDPLRPEMCRVPYGSFYMGTDHKEIPEIAFHYAIPEAWMLKSAPRHEVLVDAFEIGAFPVTEGEYHAFILETGVMEFPDHWIDGSPPPYRSNHPVHSLPWQAVLYYVEWISDRTGCHYRIPTEAEWEKSARGCDGRAFPWGNHFKATRCNTRELGISNTTPVGIFPSGQSPYGVFDLSGNVEEYTADLLWPYPGSAHQDGNFGTCRVTRGGVYSLDADLARCDRRHDDAFAGPTGFRLARSAADEWLGRPKLNS